MSASLGHDSLQWVQTPAVETAAIFLTWNTHSPSSDCPETHTAIHQIVLKHTQPFIWLSAAVFLIWNTHSPSSDWNTQPFIWLSAAVFLIWNTHSPSSDCPETHTALHLIVLKHKQPFIWLKNTQPCIWLSVAVFLTWNTYSPSSDCMSLWLHTSLHPLISCNGFTHAISSYLLLWSYIHAYTCAHTCMHACRHAHMHKQTHARTHARTHTHTQTQTRTHSLTHTVTQQFTIYNGFTNPYIHLSVAMPWHTLHSAISCYGSIHPYIGLPAAMVLVDTPVHLVIRCHDLTHTVDPGICQHGFTIITHTLHSVKRYHDFTHIQLSDIMISHTHSTSRYLSPWLHTYHTYTTFSWQLSWFNHTQPVISNCHNFTCIPHPVNRMPWLT